MRYSEIIVENIDDCHRPPLRTESDRDGLAVRERICDAMDQLSPELRFVFDACFVERLPLRTIAPIVGRSKSTVARWRDSAIQILQSQLEGDPLILERLKG